MTVYPTMPQLSAEGKARFAKVTRSRFKERLGMNVVGGVIVGGVFGVIGVPLAIGAGCMLAFCGIRNMLYTSGIFEGSMKRRAGAAAAWTVSAVVAAGAVSGITYNRLYKESLPILPQSNFDKAQPQAKPSAASLNLLALRQNTRA